MGPKVRAPFRHRYVLIILVYYHQRVHMEHLGSVLKGGRGRFTIFFLQIRRIFHFFFLKIILLGRESGAGFLFIKPSYMIKETPKTRQVLSPLYANARIRDRIHSRVVPCSLRPASEDHTEVPMAIQQGELRALDLDREGPMDAGPQPRRRC